LLPHNENRPSPVSGAGGACLLRMRYLCHLTGVCPCWPDSWSETSSNLGSTTIDAGRFARVVQVARHMLIRVVLLGGVRISYVQHRLYGWAFRQRHVFLLTLARIA